MIVHLSVFIKEPDFALNNFDQVFFRYFEERFPFFRFTLPVLLMLYPFIPTLIPLYLLPKYYPLHLMYLFLIVFNLRLLRDIAEKRIDRGNKKPYIGLYIANSLALIIFCGLFSFLERNLYVSSLHFNWRSFFFFLSSASLLVFSWAWYYGIRELLPEGIVRELLPHVKYPLFLIPPLFLNLHESQYFQTALYLGAVLFHAFIFEVLKNPKIKTTALLTVLLIFYTAIGAFAAFTGSGNLVFCGLFVLLGVGMIALQKKLFQSFIFIPTLFLGWGSLILKLII